MGKITIEIYQNHNPKSEAYGKYYGKAVQATTIDAKTLCKHVAMDSGVEESEVAVVYDGQLKQVKELLCNSHIIKMDGLGSFKIGVSSVGVSEADVQRRYPHFNPETEDIRKYLTAKQVKSAHLLFTPCDEIKQALRGVKFETDKSGWAAQMNKEKENV